MGPVPPLRASPLPVGRPSQPETRLRGMQPPKDKEPRKSQRRLVYIPFLTTEETVGSFATRGGEAEPTRRPDLRQAFSPPGRGTPVPAEPTQRMESRHGPRLESFQERVVRDQERAMEGGAGADRPSARPTQGFRGIPGTRDGGEGGGQDTAQVDADAQWRLVLGYKWSSRSVME